MTIRVPRRSDYEMTLFPFLAVLICTVGALVVLLVLVVQQAKAAGLRQKDDAPSGPDEAGLRRQRSAEDLAWQAEQLTHSYQLTQQEVAQQQRKLAHLEDHIQRLKEQMRDMVRRESRRETAAATAEALDQLRREIETTTQQMTAARRAFAEARAAAQQRRPSYAIVPYEGPQGTTRRPIYVECLKDRVVLQPEGIVLVASDFQPPLGPGNPLSAALRAKADYWAGLIDDPQPARPYPLLLVRPSGAESYAACRAAMQAWQSEFGYELIPAEMQLDYPEADPQLTQQLTQIVQDARARQATLRRAAPSQYGEFAAGLRPSRRGGFESVTDRAANDRGGGSQGPRGRPGARDAHDPELEPNSPGSFAPSSALAGGRHSPLSTHADRPPTSPSSQPLRLDPPTPRRPSPSPSANPATATASGRQGAIRGGTDVTHSTTDRSPGETGAASGVGEARAGELARTADADGATDAERGLEARGADAGAATDAEGAAEAGAAASPAGGAAGAAGIHYQSLAASRGSNWALPNVARHAVGIRRPIRIRIAQAQLVLLAEPGSKDMHRTFPVGESPTQTVDQLVDAIWKKMETWGIAGTGAYWVPRLTLTVESGGEILADRLELLLEDSGLEIVR